MEIANLLAAFDTAPFPFRSVAAVLRLLRQQRRLGVALHGRLLRLRENLLREALLLRRVLRQPRHGLLLVSLLVRGLLIALLVLGLEALR